MAKRVGKRGDTLIEVMLAVGIFSMVAVAVVAVMSGGTSSAQTALETTLAREEIDAQAEALRFIQSSYIAEKDNVDGRFSKLWQAITSKAHNNESPKDDFDANLTNYSPENCDDLYSNTGEARTQGFIIDTYQLGAFTNTNQVIVSGDMLEAAATYPRLVYTNTSGKEDNQDTLVGDGTYTKMDSAQGIYIVAVKDPGSTTIANNKNQSAYYDFYIRTCWYGTGDQTPSTISTVMRLYDPGIVKK